MERNRVRALLVACVLVVLGFSAMALSDIRIKGTDGDMQAGNQPGTRKSQGHAPTDRSRSAQMKAQKSQPPPGSVPDKTKEGERAQTRLRVEDLLRRSDRLRTTLIAMRRGVAI